MTTSTFLVLEIWPLCAFSSIKNPLDRSQRLFIVSSGENSPNLPEKKHPGHDPFGTSHKAVCGGLATKAGKNTPCWQKGTLSLGRYVVRELLTRYLPTWDKVPSLRGGHGLSPALLRVDCPGSYIEASRLYGFPISSQVLFCFFSSLHFSDQPPKSAEISFLVRLWSSFEICWSFLSGSSQVISLCDVPEHFCSSVSFFLHPLLNLQLWTLFSPGDSFLVLLWSAFEVCWISFLPPFSSFRCCRTLLDSILSSKTTVFSEYACTPVFQYCVFVFGSVVHSCAMVSVGTRSRASFFLPWHRLAWRS